MLEAWHYAKGGPNTSTYRHGLFKRGASWWCDPHGGSLWLPPTRRAAESVAGENWEGVLCLSRLVVSPDAPPNAASFLLGRSMKMINRRRWPVLLTYADLAHGHTGAIYKATNWTPLGEVKAGDTWIDPNGRQVGRKRGRFSYTRAEVEAMGWRRMPAVGKMKFVHKVAPGG
jgi:hypothetical protein